jgi:Flp pilus assembly pilin Flp
MEVSIRVAVAAIVVLIVVVVSIALITQMSGDAGNQVEGIFSWISDLIGGSPTQ